MQRPEQKPIQVGRHSVKPTHNANEYEIFREGKDKVGTVRVEGTRYVALVGSKTIATKPTLKMAVNALCAPETVS